MLRIKESEWQRFCDNAEKFYLYKRRNNTYMGYYDSIFWGQIPIICVSKTIISFNIENEQCTSMALNCIYDLIQQGYVEKVEE